MTKENKNIKSPGKDRQWLNNIVDRNVMNSTTCAKSAVTNLDKKKYFCNLILSFKLDSVLVLAHANSEQHKKSYRNKGEERQGKSFKL